MADLTAIIGDIESFRAERCESLKDTDKFCKAICSFANDMPNSGLPGYLMLGVRKDGSPSGANIEERLLEQLACLRDDGNIIPIPSMNVSKHTIAGSDIAVVEVFPSDSPPVRYKQTVWIRTGPSADRATQEQERRLEERRIDRAKTWDMQACDEASLNDLALDIFTTSYLSRSVSAEVLLENHRTIEEQLGSLRLFHRRLMAPTNGAVLLFGKDPLYFFPSAYAQYVKYDGMDLASTPITERRFSGDLLSFLRGLDQLAKELENTRPVRNPDLSETMVSDYPAIALHELLVNAVIHRNYQGTTTPISVNHFTDRIEIHNPGSLYGDLTTAQFPSGISYRNPLLAEGAKIFGFANRFGRGIALAQSLLKKNGSPPLDYVIGTNHMVMIVRRRL